MRKVTQYAALLVIGILGIELMFPVSDSRIHSKIFQRLVTVDDTYRGRLNPAKVYVSKRLVSKNYPLEQLETEMFLSPSSIDAISDVSSRMNIEITWVNSEKEITRNEDGVSEEGIPLIQFGEAENYVIYKRVNGSIYIAKNFAGGARYGFSKALFTWIFLFKSMEWIS